MCYKYQIIERISGLRLLFTAARIAMYFQKKNIFSGKITCEKIIAPRHPLANLRGTMDEGYKIRNQGAIHFITFAVVGWVDVFTRREYRDIVLNSIKYCQSEKDLLLHCWCIMSNHLHLIASAKNKNLSDILRDFKKFTSKEIISAIESNLGESRKEWMLDIFQRAGEKNSRNKKYQFWRQDNCPQELYSSQFIFQKMNYTHNNPVKAGIVERPEHYLYSSAKDYFHTRKCGLLDLIFL